LFDYNNHCNQKLADVWMANSDNTSEQSIKLYSHIVNAHQIWNGRIEPGQLPFGVWEIHPVDRCKDIDLENYQNTLGVLDQFKLTDATHFIHPKGYKLSIRDMLFHVINHSTYHRAQIATEFRQHGITPVATDCIFYKK
jgi:uncharacterized damage-inducible protein DinB